MMAQEARGVPLEGAEGRTMLAGQSEQESNGQALPRSDELYGRINTT